MSESSGNLPENRIKDIRDNIRYKCLEKAHLRDNILMINELSFPGSFTRIFIDSISETIVEEIEKLEKEKLNQNGQQK